MMVDGVSQWYWQMHSHIQQRLADAWAGAVMIGGFGVELSCDFGFPPV
jgi:hypothetical protein